MVSIQQVLPSKVTDQGMSECEGEEVATRYFSGTLSGLSPTRSTGQWRRSTWLTSSSPTSSSTSPSAAPTTLLIPRLRLVYTFIGQRTSLVNFSET